MDFQNETKNTIRDRDDFTDEFFSQVLSLESLHEDDEEPVKDLPKEEIPKNKKQEENDDYNIFGDNEKNSRKSFFLFATMIVIMILLSFICGVLTSKIFF